MKVQKYLNDRKIEMVTEAQALEKRRQGITQQGQQLQAELNQVNQKLLRLDVELELLNKMEANLNGHKEVEKC